MQDKEKINSEICYDTKLKLIRSPLLAFAKSKILNKQDSEDIVQDCLLILSKKRNEYDPNKSWRSWAFRICHFQIKGYLSRSKRKKVLNILDEENMSPESLGYFESKLPFQDLIQEEKRSVLKQIKTLLNKTEKEVFSLSLKGWSPKDIMYTLKITQSNYSVSKSRALKKAQALFANKSIKNYKP
jgi:RNA polymerase sigma factor (sigma-70 family)